MFIVIPLLGFKAAEGLIVLERDVMTANRCKVWGRGLGFVSRAGGGFNEYKQSLGSTHLIFFLNIPEGTLTIAV